MAIGFPTFTALVDAHITTCSTQITSFSMPLSAGSSGNRWLDLSIMNTTGSPVANTYSGTALTSATLSSGIYIGDTLSGGESRYLSDFLICSGGTSAPTMCHVLCDYLLYYPGLSLDVATTQTLTNSVSLPRYTSGVGVMAFIVLTVGGSAAGSCVLNYTNSDGTSGRTSQTVTGSLTNGIGFLIAQEATYGWMIPLQSGDIGIKSVESVTFSGSGAAGVKGALVLCRPLATISVTRQGPTGSNWVGGSYNYNFAATPATMPRIYDGAYLSFISKCTVALSSAPPIQGLMTFVTV